MYNLKQLNRDLETIVCFLGKRVCHGYFTIGVYEDDLIRIVDRYTDPNGPEIYLKSNSEWTRLGKPFNTDCWPGARILSLALQLEEVYSV